MTKEVNNMGMTNKQFNGFIRFIIDALNDIFEGLDEESPQKSKLKKVIENLQDTLEDDGNS